MEECDKNNPDITAAFYNVEKMRERAFVEESDLYPHINSRDYYMRDGRSDGFLPVPTGTYNSWVVGLGTTWDLDLFGRIQSMVVKERALVQASYNLYCNLMLSIHARIASEYFFARQCESEIKLLSDTLKVRKIQTEFVQKRLSLKFASKLDLSRAKVLEYEAASQLDYVKRQLDAAKNRIALLCGRSATDFELKCAPLTDSLPNIPKVFPSQLLERRPDIAAAERNVYAANAQLGADTAAFFPTISITGDVGSSKYLGIPSLSPWWLASNASATYPFRARFHAYRDEHCSFTPPPGCVTTIAGYFLLSSKLSGRNKSPAIFKSNFLKKTFFPSL